jgi:DNA replication protein DnaC
LTSQPETIPSCYRRSRHAKFQPHHGRYQWTCVFGSERLTGALLDQLTHHVHILEMNGDSYRLNQSKRRPRPASSDTPADNPIQA